MVLLLVHWPFRWFVTAKERVGKQRLQFVQDDEYLGRKYGPGRLNLGSLQDSVAGYQSVTHSKGETTDSRPIVV